MLGWDRPLPSGHCPLLLFLRGGHKAAFMDLLMNVSDAIPDPPEPRGARGAVTRGAVDRFVPL